MNKALRIIDANFNRAREGLRVIEDGLRFYYDVDRYLIKKVKEIRHSLSITVDKYFGLSIIKRERETLHDKGKYIDTRGAGDIKQVIERNFMRVSEALRVMEEYSRTTVPSASGTFHSLRFKLYGVEKEVILALHKKEVPVPFVSVLLNIDIEPSVADMKKIIDGMPDILIVSYSGKDGRYFLNTAKKIKKLVPPSIIYLIHGRPDVCLLCGANGVFLNKKDISFREVKKILPGRVVLTEDTKNVRIPLTSNVGNNAILSCFKESYTKDTYGIILIAGKEVPDNTGKIIKMLKKEVDSYGRRRKTKPTREK